MAPTPTAACGTCPQRTRRRRRSPFLRAGSHRRSCRRPQPRARRSRDLSTQAAAQSSPTSVADHKNTRSRLVASGDGGRNEQERAEPSPRDADDHGAAQVQRLVVDLGGAAQPRAQHTKIMRADRCCPVAPTPTAACGTCARRTRRRRRSPFSRAGSRSQSCGRPQRRARRRRDLSTQAAARSSPTSVADRRNTRPRAVASTVTANAMSRVRPSGPHAMPTTTVRLEFNASS